MTEGVNAGPLALKDIGKTKGRALRARPFVFVCSLSGWKLFR
jgi:hypothetical protein